MYKPKRKNKRIEFGKKCLYCDKPPIIGLIDLSAEAAHMALCGDHLMFFSIELQKHGKKI